MKEDSTIYDAFLEKNHHAERTGKEQVKPGINDVAAAKKPVQQKKQSKGDKKKDKGISLEEALSKVHEFQDHRNIIAHECFAAEGAQNLPKNRSQDPFGSVLLHGKLTWPSGNTSSNVYSK